MNTTELGVYILGAVALAVLTAAGITAGSNHVVLCAVLSSGFAYAAQFFAAWVARSGAGFAYALNAIFLAAALLAWCAGVLALLGV